MKIYQNEKNCGIADLISTNASIAYCSPLSQFDFEQSKKVPRILEAFANIAAANSDLHPLHDIMVSSGWNLNDDVFTKKEIWAARETPKFKKFNFAHIENDIIGVIIGSLVIDEKMTLIADDTKPDDLPNKFHILNSSVLYKFWRDEALAARMDKILEDIAEGKYFVSMECFFDDFDYALSSENEQYIIARDEKTSFLSKYLRAYKGKGEYDKYKIGRAIKNMTFSGKGLVERPANPASIIFQDIQQFAGLFSSSSIVKQEKEYISISAEVKMDEKEVAKLEEKVSKAQAKLNEAEAKLEKAEDTLAANAKDLKVKDRELVSKASDLEAAEKTNKELAEAKDSLTKELAEVKAALKTAEETAKATKDELAALKVEAAKAGRISLLLKAGKKKADAEAVANSLANLSDEQFKVVVATLTVAKKSESEDEMETDASDALDNAEADEDLALGGDAKADSEDLNEIKNFVTAQINSKKSGKSKKSKGE